MLQPKPQWEWGNDTSPHPPSSLHYTLHGRRSIMVVIHWPPTLDEMKPCDVTAVVLYCPTDQMSATLVLPIIHFLTRNIIKISSVFLKLQSLIWSSLSIFFNRGIPNWTQFSLSLGDPVAHKVVVQHVLLNYSLVLEIVMAEWLFPLQLFYALIRQAACVGWVVTWRAHIRRCEPKGLSV